MGMGFIEWSNEKNQNLDRYQRVDVRDWVNQPLENINVWGGRTEQRNAVVEYAVSRYLGKIGIVVLHNNDVLERDLMQFQKIYPEIFRKDPDIKACFVNGRNLVYEPLEGMDKNRIAEIIYPESTTEYQKYSQSMEALKVYLDIITKSGKSMNLDHLLTLCNMNQEQLERRVLVNFPAHMAENYSDILTRDNQALQVGADLRNFAGKLDGRIWSEDAEQTSISMVRAVENRALITIRMPSENRAVQDYLAAELEYMIERNMKFVLVIDSVNMKESRLKNIAMNPAANFCTILAGNSHMELGDCAGAEENQNQLLYRADKIILFQCGNARIAQLYSSFIGNYLKKVISYHEDKHRGAFDIFAGHGKGKGVAEQDFARVRPEELTSLRDGAVLIDQRNGKIEIAGKFVY